VASGSLENIIPRVLGKADIAKEMCLENAINTLQTDLMAEELCQVLHLKIPSIMQS